MLDLRDGFKELDKGKRFRVVLGTTWNIKIIDKLNGLVRNKQKR